MIYYRIDASYLNDCNPTSKRACEVNKIWHKFCICLHNTIKKQPMYKSCILIVFILISQFARSQDNSDPFELGVTLVTINSFDKSSYSYQGKAPLEILNGIFFRYHYEKFAFRFLCSYRDYLYVDEQLATPGEIGYEERNKDFRIGCGAQYNLLKTKQWLYLFTDVLYRKVELQGGHMNSGTVETIGYTTIGKGVDSFLGIGAQVKLFNNLYLSPELAYNFTLLSTKTDEYTISPNSKTKTYNGSTMNGHFVLKVHLSLRF